MATNAVQKIDSNVTGLRYQEETGGCIGVPNTANPWLVLEPNSYDDFGGEFSTVARNPINAGRQRQKGVLVDLDASGGFQSDVTQENLQDILQGFFFADLRSKADVGDDRQSRRAGLFGEYEDYTVTDITGTDTFVIDQRVAISAAVVAGGTGYNVGDVVEVTDANATVNARFIVTAETGNVVDSVDLVDVNGLSAGGLEGRTHTDTGAGAATTAITGSGNDDLTLTVTYGDGLSWQAGDLIWTTGFDDSANNGLHVVTSFTSSPSAILTGSTLVDDASPNVDATLTTVGWEGGAGVLDIDASGALPRLTDSGSGLDTLGLIPGEWIFIGGDLAAEAFTNVDTDGNEVNNGWARIHAIDASGGYLEFDKTSYTMTTEASTTETIRLWFGRALKNESDPTLQVRRTYQLERQLGVPDADFPSQIQAEYLEGWVPNELTLNYATADKITADLSGLALDVSTVDGPNSLKAGPRPDLVASDAFNTSNDISRLKLAVLDRTAGSAPTALFAFLTEFSVVINNNLSPNKAISVLGAFDITAGQFNVEGSMEAYFADVTAVSSIRNNDDVTFDVAQVKGSTGAKAGMLIDVPLITLGDGRLDVTQDEPITLPLDIPAGADRVFDHTLLMMFYDYLPDRADT